MNTPRHSLYLHGSAASGDDIAGSDVDLLAIVADRRDVDAVRAVEMLGVASGIMRCSARTAEASGQVDGRSITMFKMKWSRAILAVATGCALFAVATLLMSFSTNDTPLSPPADFETRCSSPLRQLVDPPSRKLPTTESVGADGGVTKLTAHDVQPSCKDVGRSRAAASGALLLASAFAAGLGMSIRGKDRDRVRDPLPL